MSEGKHLDKEGINEILALKSKMTLNRYNNKER